MIRHAIVKVVLIAAAVVAVALVARHYIGRIDTAPAPAAIVKNEGIDITPMQIRQIEQIGQWEFLTINDEELIDTTRRGFFGDDQLVRIYYGTLRLGIDMRQAHEGWLTAQGDTVRAVLPPVTLLDANFIDEARTRSFIQSGKWTHDDRRLMYNRAAAAMRQRCLTPTNYATARQNAIQQFTQLLHSMGYDKVIVSIEGQK